MQIIWDITRRCNLKCKFCYASPESQQHREKLTWETIREKILPKFDELGVDASDRDQTTFNAAENSSVDMRLNVVDQI